MACSTGSVGFFETPKDPGNVAAMQAERRVFRSQEPSRAIRIFLAKNAGEPGLKAAVVASDDGWYHEDLFTRRVSVGEETFTIASVGAPLRSTSDIEALLGRLLA